MRQVTSEILDRQPPADEPAEKALVGCLIYDPACWAVVQPLVDPSDFYGSAYRSIAEVVWNLFASNVTPDAATLLPALKSHRVHPEQPAWAFLIADAVDNSTGTNAETYAKAIRAAAVKRRLRDAALNAVQRIYEADCDANAIASQMLADVERIRKQLVGGLVIRETTLQQASFDSIESLEAGTTQLVRLGLPGVDDAIGGGMAYGEIVILGARSSHGKSAVALQALHNVSQDGLPSLFVSLEMTSAQLGKRTLQFASAVPAEQWHRSTRELIADVSEHFHGREQVYIFEASNDKDNHCDNVCQVIRRYVKDHGVRVVVVDYAQLIENRNGKNRYEQMTATSIAMRQLANECKIVLLLLCQLNRDIEKREVFIPKISDIRETGQFEQDADTIIFLVWPNRIDQQRDPKEFNFYIAKNRNRPYTPFVKCVFEPSRQMFSREIPVAEPFNADDYNDWHNR